MLVEKFYMVKVKTIDPLFFRDHKQGVPVPKNGSGTEQAITPIFFAHFGCPQWPAKKDFRSILHAGLTQHDRFIL